MDATKFGISCCQRCRHYSLEGRRGGHCDQLNVSVQGRWSPCPLASPVFTESISAVTQAEPVVSSQAVTTAYQVSVWSNEVIYAHREANRDAQTSLAETV